MRERGCWLRGGPRIYRALEAGLVQMAGVEEGSREELLRRVACAEEGAVVMKVRGWRVMWPARERYLSNTDSHLCRTR